MRAQTQEIRALKTLWSIIVCGSLAVAQKAELMPPSQSVAPAIVTADSGMKGRNIGAGWSKWYRLAVGKAPKGYTVQKVEFWLTGAQTCGVLAECRELVRTDDEVLWEFRLQGNSELGAANKVDSEGHIRVIYRPR